MLQIKKMRCDHVLDFAAEELKKYLRMMMPEGGDVAISTEPDAKDGFRLGLLEDFGLPFEGEDKRIDDVVHVDTQEDGGILAGSNPRSVLFAVYRFLKLHGCRCAGQTEQAAFLEELLKRLQDFMNGGETV